MKNSIQLLTLTLALFFSTLTFSMSSLLPRSNKIQLRSSSARLSLRPAAIRASLTNKNTLYSQARLAQAARALSTANNENNTKKYTQVDSSLKYLKWGLTLGAVASVAAIASSEDPADFDHVKKTTWKWTKIGAGIGAAVSGGSFAGMALHASTTMRKPKIVIPIVALGSASGAFKGAIISAPLAAFAGVLTITPTAKLDNMIEKIKANDPKDFWNSLEKEINQQKNEANKQLINGLSTTQLYSYMEPQAAYLVTIDGILKSQKLNQLDREKAERTKGVIEARLELAKKARQEIESRLPKTSHNL